MYAKTLQPRWTQFNSPIIYKGPQFKFNALALCVLQIVEKKAWGPQSARATQRPVIEGRLSVRSVPKAVRSVIIKF